jgi:hypothetical protein
VIPNLKYLYNFVCAVDDTPGQDIVKWDFKMNAIIVTYDGNGSTSGTVPIDSNNNTTGAAITVARLIE